MNIGGYTPNLSQISGGTLAAGTVPLARMLRLEVNAANAGSITLTSGADIQCLTLDCGTVVAGDIIYVAWSGQPNVVGTTKDWQTAVNKSAGTATVVQGNAGTEARYSYGNGSNAYGTIAGAAIFKVTVGGTLTLQVVGQFTGGAGHQYNAAGIQAKALVLVGA